MLVTLQGKNFAITEAMKECAIKKLSTLDKYFKEGEVQTKARILVKVYEDAQKVEITVDSPVGVIRSEVRAHTFYEALDASIDKLEDQIRRQKTRLSKKHREKLSVAFLDEIAEYEAFIEQQEQSHSEAVRTKVVVAQEMDLTTAIMKMEMLNHDFFIYTDDETKKPAVVYRRKNGGYGLLEIENE